MEVHLTPQQEAFLEQNVRAGRFNSKQEAIGRAVDLLEEHERAMEELRAAVDEGDEDFAQHHYAEYTDETLPQLAGELKREARVPRSAASDVPH